MMYNDIIISGNCTCIFGANLVKIPSSANLIQRSVSSNHTV